MRKTFGHLLLIFYRDIGLNADRIGFISLAAVSAVKVVIKGFSFFILNKGLYTNIKPCYNIGTYYILKGGEKVVINSMGETDKQYNGQLIDEYYRLKDIKEIAVKEDANETIKKIDEKIKQIKLKLQPLELPED